MPLDKQVVANKNEDEGHLLELPPSAPQVEQKGLPSYESVDNDSKMYTLEEMKQACKQVRKASETYYKGVLDTLQSSQETQLKTMFPISIVAAPTETVTKTRNTLQLRNPEGAIAKSVGLFAPPITSHQFLTDNAQWNRSYAQGPMLN